MEMDIIMDCKIEDSERYDVIVIGGGLGGLSSAALLARHGHKVVLFEQHCNVGGYASRFCRKAPDGDYFRFEASIHTIAGCGENGAVSRVLREAGAEEDVKFLDLSESTMKVVLPNKRVVDLSYHQEEFAEMLAAQFPAERQSIERFFSDLNKIWDILPATKAKTLFRTPEDMDSELAHSLFLPLNSILSSYFTDKRIFHYLYLPISYVGLNLSEIEFLKYVVSMREFFRERSYWILGGSQNLSDAFAHAIIRHGGHLRTGSRVKKILVERSRVIGVELEDGNRYFSDHIISNADATSTFLEMIGEDGLPSDFVLSLKEMTATTSFFQVYLGLNKEFKIPAVFSAAFEICIMNESDGHMRSYPFVGLTNYTLLDPSLATGGKQILTIAVPMKIGNLSDWGVSGFKDRNEEYYTKKNAITEELIIIVESIFPGLREHIIVKEAATPLTFERYTLNKNGSYMGFDARYERLPQKTPIEGLYLAGGWTEPHAGVMGVIISGQRVMEKIYNTG
jgi:phytoene dehydrogenase-like protein